MLGARVFVPRAARRDNVRPFSQGDPMTPGFWSRFSTYGLRAAFVVGVAAAPLAAHAELAKWDQTRVTAIANELSEAVAKAAIEVDKQKGSRVDVGKERAFYEFREDMRLAKNTSRHLARELENGESREETYPTFKRLKTLRNDAAENARRADMPDSAIATITAAGELLVRLRPYYEEEPADKN
jgi:hypothetical protein